MAILVPSARQAELRSSQRPVTALSPSRRYLVQAILAIIVLLIAWRIAAPADDFTSRLHAQASAQAEKRESLRFPQARAPVLSARLHYANGAVQELFPTSTAGDSQDEDVLEALWEKSAILRVEIPPAGLLDFRVENGSSGVLGAGNALHCQRISCTHWTGVRFRVSLEAALDYLQQADPASEALIYLPAPLPPSPRSVTLVTQLSVSRLPRFDRLLKAWDGPISASIYLVDEQDLVRLCTYLRNLQAQDEQRWARLTLTILKPSYAEDEPSLLLRLRYPINRLRNLAIEASPSPYILVIDVDFVPSPQMHQHLIERAIPLIEAPTSRNAGSSPTLRRTAVVIPTFALAADHEGHDDHLPTSVDELERLYHARPQKAMLTDPNSGHGPTRPARFFHHHRHSSHSHMSSAPDPHSHSYEVCYEPQWEPYYLLHRASHPLYDERFTDQGGDKQSHALLLNALGFQFRVVAGEVWVLHPPKRDAKEEAWPAARLAELLKEEGGGETAGSHDSDDKAKDQHAAATDNEDDHFNLSAQKDRNRYRYFQDYLPEMERLWDKWTLRWPRGCSAELVVAQGGGGGFFGRARPRSVFGL
ncbi:hypothetical protein JCM10908_003787 [Rhodotorula pacifica]|uniref:uncharacterized protein n=1 Tax=Rhodotorula pacifica TaxID=1495444 RepID=UPI003182AC45